MVAVAPVMEADPDLQDPVVEPADRRAGVAPERLKGLVLLEELACVELLDPPQERIGRRFIAAMPIGLLDLAARDACWRASRLPLAASGLGRVRRREVP